MAGIPAELLAPPSGGVRPPVEPRAELAPLDALSWSDFERLCVALAREDGEPEHVQRYGGPGQNQQGIDVYARRASGRYRVYQCKRYQQLGAADLRRLVDTFLAGTWANRAEALVVCTSASAVRTERAEAIEEQARGVRTRGVSLEIWDADELSRRLKELPVVVLDFFGRAWVSRLCTVGLPESAARRLDVDELQRLRSRLGCFYKELFSRHAGSLGSRTPVTLDVLRERRLPASRDAGEQAESDTRQAPAAGAIADDPVVQERLPLPVWLGRTRRALLLGGAGTGKSTALRNICLDLLSTSPTIEELADWGGLLPLWVPFGTWAGRAADTSADASLTAAVHGFFASYDEPELGELAVAALGDERLVLLVDGLDESSDERATRRATDRLQQVVAMRDPPVVATGRPEALASLGSLGPAWQRAEVAPLSDRQAREVLAAHGAPDGDVETLLASLARQRGVHALSRVPLLLTLLWRSWRPADPMPGNRTAALELVLTDLIHEHPRRRELAGGPLARPQRLSAGDVQTAVEELALTVQHHGAGPVPEHDARIALGEVLRARGFTAEEATADARELLAMASGSMGLVVDDEPGLVFAHRALQEHLAARALLRRDGDVRESIVAEHRATPAWRAVLLGVLCLLGEPAETSRLVEAIGAGAGRRERWAITGLLAEAAVHAPAVPAALRRKLLDAAAEEVESGLHAGVRHEVLDALAEAIGSPRLDPIATRMQRWLPGRLGWHFGVWDELARWPAERAHRSHVEYVLFNGLQHDDDRNAREAAKALSGWSSNTVCERLAALLDSPIPAQQRTAALEAFSRQRPDDPRTERWMATARRSPHTALRLVAIDWRVREHRHDRDDLQALLRLADDWTQVDPAWSSSIRTVLQAGWPDDPEVRGHALQAVYPAAGRPIEIRTATWLLLAGYFGDSEVVAWIASEVDSEHPFVTLDDLEVYRLLAARAVSEPEVLEAVDRRLPTMHTAFMPSIYGAALVTRSLVAKRRLLALLTEEDSGALGWVVRALQEGWPSDDEVLSALRDLSRRPAAAWVADQLARCVADEQRDGWLLGLLADPDNPRPARAAVALNERGDASREAALQTALGRQHDGGFRAEELRRVLIELYADLPAGERLAHELIDHPDTRLATVARGARRQPSLREPVLERLGAIPQALRRRLAERVRDGAGEPRSAAALVRGWQLEASPAAGATAGAAVARRCEAADREALLEHATEALHAPALRDEEAQTALAVLIEAGAPERFAAERRRWGDHDPVTVRLDDTLHRNLPLAALLAARWEEVAAVMPDPAIRLGESSHGAWEALAPFAAAYPAARDACLQFVREHGTESRPPLLAFVADARPRSQELLSALVDVALGRPASAHPRRDALLEAAELLAQHFGSAGEPPGELVDDGRARHQPGILLALALGWRRSDAFERAIHDYNANPWPLDLDISWRLQLAVSRADDARRALDDYLLYAADHARHLSPLPRVLEHRLVLDDALAEQLDDAVQDASCPPSRLVSYGRLLSGAGRLTGAVRDVVERRCDEALESAAVDVLAFDLLASEVRPLGLALLDALQGDQGRASSTQGGARRAH